jgi:hypothetical protein
MDETFASHFSKVKEKLRNFGDEVTKTCHEMGDLKGALLKALDENQRQKTETAKRHYEELEDLFRASSVEAIPFTPDLLFRGKRRIISGSMPDQDLAKTGEKKTERRDRESDAIIIETLQSYFERHVSEGAVLYFCSENVRDFGHDGDDGLYLDASVREGLPRSFFFKDVRTLIDFANDPKEVKEPTPEQEKKDLEKEKQEEYQRRIAELGWLRRRSAVPDADSTDAGYNAILYQHQHRHFPWGAYYPTATQQVIVVPPQDEILPFVDTPQPIITHGPPPSPQSHPSVAAKAGDPVETSPNASTPGPASDVTTAKEASDKEE